MLAQQITGPTDTPCTLEEAREHASVFGFTDDDAMLTRFVKAASRSVGEWAGRVLNQETWAVSFPNGFCGDLHFPKSPVQSVTSITYFDKDDVEQTALVSDFYLTKSEDGAFLRPKAGVSWPTANATRADAITVTFVAGYATCPDNLATAVAAMAAHIYDNRLLVSEKKMHEVPLGIAALIEPDRIGWVKA